VNELSLLATNRPTDTATLLANGQVLLGAGSTGRSINEAVTDSAELFDPATNRFIATGNLAAPRHKHAAVRLRDGKVLVIGGADSRLRGFYNSAELYDPATGKFSPTGAMSVARYKIREAAALLVDGRVLIAGGGTRLEIYDPATGVFSLLSDRVTMALRYSTTTLLGNGTALIAGGYGGEGLPSAGAWLYLP
jgi:galactose oxidase-like protein